MKLEWTLGFDEIKLVHGKKIFASVYPNGVWHTWDENGVGGENSSCDTVQKAQEEAAQSAISQGFIDI